MIPTGFRTIDYNGCMLKRGKLSVIGGRPSMGKTGFALNLTARLLEQGYKVCYVSTELSSENLLKRFETINGRNDVSGLFIIDGLNVLSDASDWENMLESECPNADVLIIDMLPEHVAASVAGMIAAYSDVAFMVLLPVSRDVEERDDHRPGVWDITEIDAIRKYVYCAATIYREDYYGSGISFGDGLPHCLELLVHVWDSGPSLALLDVGKDFVLSDFRGGFELRDDFEDTREGIFRFIDSKDYRKFFGAAGYDFSPLEKTWLAWSCKSALQSDKLEAMLAYASEDSEFVLGLRPWFIEEMTLGEFVRAYVDDAKGISMLTDDREWIRDGFSALWLDFPVPFSKGDLLVKTDGSDKTIYLYPGDSVITGKMYRKLEKYGDSSDMCITVWSYDSDLGFMHSHIMPFELEAYEGNIHVTEPVLGLVSDYMKKDIDMLTMLDGLHEAMR